MHRAYAMYKEQQKCTTFWCVNMKEKTPLGKPRHTREYNNKMDSQETGWEGVDWIHLAKDRDK
jgi:hypothetical protein